MISPLRPRPSGRSPREPGGRSSRRLVVVESDLAPVGQGVSIGLPGRALVVVAGGADLGALQHQALRDRQLPIDHDLLLAVVLAGSVAGLALDAEPRRSNFFDTISSGTPYAVTWHLTHFSSVWGSATPASAAHFFRLLAGERLEGLGVLRVEPGCRTGCRCLPSCGRSCTSRAHEVVLAVAVRGRAGPNSRAREIQRARSERSCQPCGPCSAARVPRSVSSPDSTSPRSASSSCSRTGAPARRRRASPRPDRSGRPDARGRSCGPHRPPQ